jgi:alpha-N-arabinofuranosidase
VRARRPLWARRGADAGAGIKVQSNWTYNGSFYAKSSTYSGPITVSLVSNASASHGHVYATAHAAAHVSKSWTKYTYTLKPTSSAPTADNYLAFSLAPSGSAPNTVSFGLFSLFPPTYKGRPNGMRIDLAEAMAATAPRIWRFPGGNNLEGTTIASRWKWNETIGPCVLLVRREGGWGADECAGSRTDRAASRTGVRIFESFMPSLLTNRKVTRTLTA